MRACYSRRSRNVGGENLASSAQVLEGTSVLTHVYVVSPDFGFVAMNEHMPHHYSKVAGDL
ncbi:hypothetical protein D9619_000843 [Psilocybe cf. subviscida]|uniref:Uncharacterized protein n=1 Tax=Psilocybe cf. subviscida TaxID=2480587 RepID=A0A8H5F3A0_9AGAR|nr:hypothetical protein D9619_000843 [Psilocybe cf. subviscida]